MIVVDASAVVELLLVTDTGLQVGERLRSEALHAPAHLDAEVVGALRRAVIRSLVTRHEALDAVSTLNDLPVRRWALPPLSAAAFDHMDVLTVADAYYVALAAGIDANLITCDRPLSRAHGLGVAVELIGA